MLMMRYARCYAAVTLFIDEQRDAALRYMSIYMSRRFSLSAMLAMPLLMP